MKKKQRDEKIDEICNRLDELDVEDRKIIKPHSADRFVTLTLAQLEAYGKRLDERRALTKELALIAGQPIEKD